jgi:hypothetical protein
VVHAGGPLLAGGRLSVPDGADSLPTMTRDRSRRRRLATCGEPILGKTPNRNAVPLALPHAQPILRSVSFTNHCDTTFEA